MDFFQDKVDKKTSFIEKNMETPTQKPRQYFVAFIIAFMTL